MAEARLAALFAGGVTLALILACAGPPPDPSVLSMNAVRGSCGVYTIHVTSDGSAEVLVTVDGETVGRGVGNLQLTQRAGSADRPEILAKMGRYRVEDRLGWGDWDVGVSVSPSETLPVNDPGRIELRVWDACDPPEQLELHVVAGGSEALVAPVPPEGVVHWEPPALGEGAWPVQIEVRSSTDGLLGRVVEHTLFYGPPCPDEDGDGYACRSDCEPFDPAIHPGAEDVHGDGVDQDCDGVNGVDRDRDGYEDADAGGDDCDDRYAGTHPGAPEEIDADNDGYGAADGRDNDCDGRVDEGIDTPDCDDHDPRVNPRQAEAPLPNGKDDNCDGRVDEGTTAYDDDGDGVSEDEGDCDDHDASTHPGARELPDCWDNDCDHQVDEGVTRPARDDGYEQNDAMDVPFDLGQRGRRRFRQRLDLVTRGGGDQEWFEFASDDGPLDHWGLVAFVPRLPAGSQYRVGFYTLDGHRKVAMVLGEEGGTVRYEGRSGQDDSGTYLLGIEPLDTPRDWCPVEVTVKSR